MHHIRRNAAWNGLTALTDLDSTTYLQSSPGAEPLTRRLMHEIITIARALGIETDPFEPGIHDPAEAQKIAEGIGRKGRLADELITMAVVLGPVGSSMRTDVQNGRPLEADVGLPLSYI